MKHHSTDMITWVMEMIMKVRDQMMRVLTNKLAILLQKSEVNLNEAGTQRRFASIESRHWWQEGQDELFPRRNLNNESENGNYDANDGEDMPCDYV